MTPANPERSQGCTLVTVWRLRAKLTQEQLVEMTGLSLSAIHRAEEKVQADPRLLTYIKLARALGCRIEDLVEDEWDEPLPGAQTESVEEARRRA